MPAKPRLVTLGDKTLSLTAWAAETGIPATTIASRLNAGETPEQALTRPSDKRFKPTGRPAAEAPRPCPRMKPHKGTGQACAVWVRNGERHVVYFGPWKSKDAAAAYARFAAEWAVGAVDRPGKRGGVLVADLCLRWLEHCHRTYQKRGKITSEVHCNRTAFAPVVKLYGDQPAAAFTPKRLEVVREEMVKKGWYRNTINAHVGRVVRAWSWAVVQELVPAAVADALRHVKQLPAGRTSAPESQPRRPVPAGQILAVMPHLHAVEGRRRVFEGMVRFQVLTGMRPGELCALRPEDLDRSRDEWRYDVTEFNKMLHKDVSRTVWVGPKAQAVIAPFLAASVAGRSVFQLPPRYESGEPRAVSVAEYRDAIRQACQLAGVPEWTPHRLRHTRATEVMRVYEDDRAVGQAIGDTPEVARQVYAHNPGEAVARRIARETG